jgi:hypothetical protein
MARDETAPVSADARQWRPQTVWSGRGSAEIVNPIAEPLWSGERVTVLYRDSEHADEWGAVEVYDSYGEEAHSLAERAFDHLRRSITATEAVIDGIVTMQSLGAGVKIDFEGEENRPPTKDPAFVAIDGLIRQSRLVRISPWVSPPLYTWFRTWTNAGFHGLVIKAANSRYAPGKSTMEWITTDRAPRI